MRWLKSIALLVLIIISPQASIYVDAGEFCSSVHYTCPCAVCIAYTSPRDRQANHLAQFPSSFFVVDPDDDQQSGDSANELPSAEVDLPRASSVEDVPAPVAPTGIDPDGFFYDRAYASFNERPLFRIGISQNFTVWNEGTVVFEQRIGSVPSRSQVDLQGPGNSMTGVNLYAPGPGPLGGFEFGFVMPFEEPPVTVIDTKTDRFTVGRDTRHLICVGRPYTFYAGTQVADVALPIGLLEAHLKGGVLVQRVAIDTHFDQSSGGGRVTRTESRHDNVLPFLGAGAYWTLPRLPNFQLFGTANFVLNSSHRVSVEGVDSFGNPTLLDFSPALPLANFGVGVLFVR